MDLRAAAERRAGVSLASSPSFPLHDLGRVALWHKHRRHRPGAYAGVGFLAWHELECRARPWGETYRRRGRRAVRKRACGDVDACQANSVGRVFSVGIRAFRPGHRVPTHGLVFMGVWRSTLGYREALSPSVCLWCSWI